MPKEGEGHLAISSRKHDTKKDDKIINKKW